LEIIIEHFFKDFIYYFRERAGGGEEGEGQRESQADSMLSGEPDTGLNLTTLRS